MTTLVRSILSGASGLLSEAAHDQAVAAVSAALNNLESAPANLADQTATELDDELVAQTMAAIRNRLAAEGVDVALAGDTEVDQEGE